MKRFLPLFFVLCFMVTMVLPVAAAETEPVEYPIWTTGTINNSDYHYSYNGFVAPGTENGFNYYNKLILFEDSDGVVKLASFRNTPQVVGGVLSLTGGCGINVPVDGGWENIAFNGTQIDLELNSITLLWSNVDVSDSQGNVLLEATFAQQLCDGSSCPATDANNDNVCDDCGLTLYNTRSVIPDPYTVWTGNRFDVFPFAFLYTYNGNNYLILSASQPYVDGGNVVIPDVASGTAYVRYTIFGDTWRLDNSYDSGGTISVDDVYPSFDMLNLDGTVIYSRDRDFFPLPLWAVTLQTAQGEITAEMTNLRETVWILTLCGVGCLALLIALPLFGKVLFRFLN